ncbi:contractile injection system tape measure protein [Serratia marcescens]|uniref:contractile injection system tape measure protein n=1 Tax=Serratia marcescens TaxID=615 RepID=UPI00288222F8|nr:contractile injection system tape measure protein [Serratia marcescens]MDT0228794.1 contractile injection system tape measure protein [Serratia marcescens]
MSTNVVVGRLRIRLHTQESHATALQDRCSRWFQTQLQRDVDAALSELMPVAGAPRVIERLTLHVGDVALSRFEAEMGPRAIRQLKQQLSKLLAHPQRRETRAGAPAPFGLGSGMPDRRPGQSVPDTFAQLLRYLDTGVIVDPGSWLRREGRSAWLVQALEGVSAAPGMEGGPPPRIALALRLLQPRARQRLVATWPGSPLSALATWLIAPSSLPALLPAEATWLLPLAALMALQQHPVISDYVPALTGGAGSRDNGGVPTDGHRGESTSVSSALRPAGRQPTSAALPGGNVPDRWFTALLDLPLSPVLRQALQAWLRGPAHGDPTFPELSRLSIPVRHALRVVLDAPERTERMPTGEAPLPTVRRQASPGHPFSLSSLPLRAGSRLPEAHRAPATLPASLPADETPAPWMVAGAGLVLLWPLLPRLFSESGWLEEGQFIDEQARSQAAGCLDWLAWGDADSADWRLPCVRVLCGIAPDVESEICSPSRAQQAALAVWLGQAFAAIPLLDRCSVNDIRTFFLQREGELSLGDRVTLAPVAEAPDVLLRNLPWPLVQIMLPWLPAPISVEWCI